MTKTDRILTMAAALRAAKRVLASERRELYERSTGIQPNPSWEQRRAARRRYDRVIAKINEALR